MFQLDRIVSMQFKFQFNAISADKLLIVSTKPIAVLIGPKESTAIEFPNCCVMDPSREFIS